MSVSGVSSLRRSSTAVEQASQQQLPLSPTTPSSTTVVQQAKRIRLSSSVNVPSSQQPSPLQSIEFSVKRSKRESHLFNFDEIFVQNSDVNYMCVLISSLQILNTLPSNVLSYLAEWTSSTIDFLKRRSYDANQTGSDYENVYNRLPKQFLFTSWNLPQIHIYHIFILYGCIDMFNFSIYLFYQFYSCRLLSIEFRKFLNKFYIFRFFLKPVRDVGRNRLNSFSRVSSSRRASKM